MARQFGFDGVDVDWEYPRTADGSKAQYEALIGLLHRQLKPEGMLLTAAVFGGVMVWEISEDSAEHGKSLLTVLGQAIASGPA